MIRKFRVITTEKVDITTENVESERVVTCLFLQGYSTLTHWNSSLSNINNNCSQSYRRLIFLQDLND